MIETNKRGSLIANIFSSYVWIVIVLGILLFSFSSFGIFNPDNLIPDRCMVNVGFHCESFVLFSDGEFVLTVANRQGKAVHFSEISSIVVGEVKLEQSDIVCSFFDGQGQTLDDGMVGRDTYLILECELPIRLVKSAGSKQSVDIDMKYSPAGSRFDNVLSLDAITSVREGGLFNE